MKGLLIKDWYQMKKIFLVLITLSIIFYVAAFYLLANAGEMTLIERQFSQILMMSFSAFLPSAFSLLYLTGIIADKGVNWERLIITMPLKSNRFLLGKYLINLAIIFIIALIGIGVRLIIHLFLNDFQIFSTVIVRILIFDFLDGFILALLQSSINLPAFFLLSQTKAYLTLIIAALISFVFWITPIFHLSILNYSSAVTIALILYSISYLITCKLYEKRDI